MPDASALNQQAVAFGARLLPARVGDIAAELYRFHRIPISPRWQTRLGSPDRVYQFLGIAALERSEEVAHAGFSVVREDTGAWLTWSRPGTARRHGDPPRATHKLFVSPLPAATPAAIAALAATISESRALAFKVPCRLDTLLRPDKIVVYFHSHAAVTALARSLQPLLRGLGAHGVPLAGQVGHDGVLAWGVDPPGPASGARSRLSWRTWCAHSIARALTEARRAGVPQAACAVHAMTSLAAEGVDLDRLDPRRVATAVCR